MILLVIMFLFRPSNNNQRFAYVPLLDHSDKDELSDDDEHNGETAIFDSVTIRKNFSTETNGKAKKTTNDNADEALDWIETNIPTSLADQAMKAFDSEEEMVNTRLERSKMQ